MTQPGRVPYREVRALPRDERVNDEIRAWAATSTPGRPASVRFRAHGGSTSFVDLIHGPYTQDVAASVGDFVVRRADGVAAYQLAVVVDDAASAITHVLRGDDLLSSTPRQLQLFEALEHPPPRYAHVPLLLGADGKRLAKRDGAVTVAHHRERGGGPERLLGLLAKWSALSDGSPVTALELLSGFSLERVARTPAVVLGGDLP